MMRAIVGYAGNDDSRAAMTHNHVLIHQDAQAEPAHFGDPCARARIIFVVSRYEVRAVRRAQSCQGLGVVR